MPRTPEQIEANEALSAAIDAATIAYGFHEQGEVNGEWVLVVNQQSFADNEVNNAYCILMKNGRIAGTNAIGLLETAAFDMKMGDKRS